LSYILRGQFKTQGIFRFFGMRLIDKIGMHSMVIEADMVIMWALLTVGQRHVIGQNSVVTSCTKKLEWGADSRGVLGKIYKPHRNVRGQGACRFWLNAGGKFPDAPRIFYCSFRDRW
jgi:hypothetical protein